LRISKLWIAHITKLIWTIDSLSSDLVVTSMYLLSPIQPKGSPILVNGLNDPLRVVQGNYHVDSDGS
jgi:hypothetical protein